MRSPLRRLALVLIAAVLVMLTAVTAIAVEVSVSILSRGVVDPVSAESLPYWTDRFGVNAELRTIPADQLDDQLALMRAAGVTWIRQEFDWNALEPERGRYDWAEYDRIVAAIDAESGIELLAVLVNTPAWARDRRALNNRTSPPQDTTDFGAFAAAVAGRYADSVDYYQIWDEPNLLTSWGMLAPSASRYATLLADASESIREIDPVAFIVAAGLAPTQERGPDNINEVAYLNDLLAFGAAQAVDAFAVKPYGMDTGPYDRTIADHVLNFSRVVTVYEALAKHSSPVPPIWATQWGWNTLPETWRGLPSIWGSVTPQQQIEYTLGALDRIQAEWPWMGPAILHHWNPPYPADHPQQGFALTRPDGTATPLLTALIERAQISPTGAPTGWHPARTPYAEYSGVWTFRDNSADIGWLRDSRVTFTFEGTSVALLLRQGDYVANLYATVDSQPSNALPRDAAGRAYIALQSADRVTQQGPVLVASGLSPGVHALTVVADQGFDQYALIGYAVGPPNPVPSWTNWRAAAWVAVAMALAGIAGVVWYVDGLLALHRAARRGFARLSTPAQFVIAGVSSAALMLTMAVSFGVTDGAWARRDPLLALVAVVSAGTVYVNLTFPLTVVALVVLQWCILQRLVLGLALTAFFAPFFLFPVALYTFSFPMVEIVLLMTFAAWAVQSAANEARRRKSGTVRRPMALSGLDVLVIAYVALGITAVAWSALKGPAITELRTLFLEPAAFYLVARTTLRSRSDLLIVICAFLAAGTVAAAIGVGQYVTGAAIITAEDGSRRLAGVYGSPNNLALFLGRVIPFAAAAVLTFGGRWRWIAAASLAVTILAAVLTQSVGGLFIGIPAGVTVTALALYGRRAVPWLIGAAVVAIVVFAVLAGQSDRFGRALDFTQGTNFYRIRVMQSAVNVIADHPLIGLGLDQFLYAFRDRYIFPDAWPEPDLSHPHNMLLDFWVRLGLGGAVLAVAFVVISLRAAVGAVRATDHRVVSRWLAAGLLGAFVAVYTHGMVDNSVFVIDLAYTFMLLLCAVQLVRRADLQLLQPNV